MQTTTEAQKTRVRFNLTASVAVERIIDEDPDFSYLGEYSSVEKPGAIDRQERGDAGPHGRRYWIPGPNHYPHNPKGWAHVKGKEKAAVIKKFGSFEKADAHYLEEDYQRCESYERGDWHYEIVSVTVRYGTLKVTESLGGIESDSSSDYFDDTESNLINGCVDELKKKLKARLDVE